MFDFWLSHLIYGGIHRTTGLFYLTNTGAYHILILSNNQLVQHITYHLLTYEWYVFSMWFFYSSLISTRFKNPIRCMKYLWVIGIPTHHGIFHTIVKHFIQWKKPRSSNSCYFWSKPTPINFEDLTTNLTLNVYFAY